MTHQPGSQNNPIHSSTQPERASFSTTTNIRFSRCFNSSEASDKFYKEVSSNLKNTRINIFVDNDEEIILNNQTIFKLYFVVTFLADNNSRNHNDIYLDTAKEYINKAYNNHKSYTKIERNNTKSVQTKINFFRQVFSPSFLTILPFIMIFAFGVYAVSQNNEHNNNEHNNQQSTPTQNNTPATGNSRSGDGRR
jgi:ATP-dependent Zn protease